MYTSDYIEIINEFKNHPVEGILITIGIVIVIVLLYFGDKRLNNNTSKRSKW